MSLDLLPSGWSEILTSDSFKQVSTNTKKVKSKECQPAGKFPVIDQGQMDVAGFIDDISKVINVKRPLVIFGDHTRIIKWVNRDFVPGADGTKILEAAAFLEPRYFYYQLRSIELPDKGYSRHFRYLNETSFRVAPLAEQQQIAVKLDELLAQVDTLKTRLDAIPKILKRFRESVLTAAISGSLTNYWREQFPELVDAADLENLILSIHAAAGGHKTGNAAAPTEDIHDLSEDIFPVGWKLVTLRDVVLPDRPITYGILKPGPELEEGVSYIRVADFPGEKLNFSTIRKTSAKIDEEFKRSRLRSGDLLLSIRGTVGRIVIIPEELTGSNTTQDSARLSVQPTMNHLYVLWYLRSSMAQVRMKKSTKGVAVRGINIGDVRALQLPLPSRKEQDEIVSRIEQLFTYADQIEQRVKDAQARVNHLTRSILVKAFRGELTADWREQNPDLISGENSAEILLARISAERKATTATNKIKRKAKA